MSELDPPTVEFKITSANRQAVKDWLAAQGFDATRVQSMRDQTLLKAYTDPRYLRALTNRGDYNPSVERNGNGEGSRLSMGDLREQCVLSPDPAGLPCSEARNAARGPVVLDDEGNRRGSMAEAELATAPAGPEHTQVVTEARVIELIRALAVLKPTGLEGLEDLL